MLHSSQNRFLEADLGTGGMAPPEVPEETLLRHLGGSGVAANLLDWASGRQYNLFERKERR